MSKPWNDLVRSLGRALEGLVDIAEAARDAQAPPGGDPGTRKPKVKVETRVRTLDGSSLDDLRELASRLSRGSAAPPRPRRAPKRLAIEVHEEDDAIIALVQRAGIQPDGLRIAVTGDMLQVELEQDDQSWSGECRLPVAVDDARRTLTAAPGLVKLAWPRAPRGGRKRRTA